MSKTYARAFKIGLPIGGGVVAETKRGSLIVAQTVDSVGPYALIIRTIFRPAGDLLRRTRIASNDQSAERDVLSQTCEQHRRQRRVGAFCLDDQIGEGIPGELTIREHKCGTDRERRCDFGDSRVETRRGELENPISCCDGEALDLSRYKIWNAAMLDDDPLGPAG